MATMHGSWKQIADSNELRRSSQVAAVINHVLVIFGGEIKPRQPVDNKLYRTSLKDSPSQGDITIDNVSAAPSPRVGSASTTLDGKVYLFSGRGGEAMAPVEEHGMLHVLNEQGSEWSSISSSAPQNPFPPARSYHAMTSDNSRTIFLHAGCPEKGRLSDLWTFDLDTKKWTQHADAPGPARGGASIAWLGGKLYRMNGFDGKHEQGFALDIYDIKTDSWVTKTWEVGSGPPARSVSTLLALQVDGKDALLTMFGESDPSNLGHQGAGKMLSDVWVYDVAEGSWKQVQTKSIAPASRGWFAADKLPDSNVVVVQGGLAEDNTRLGDIWTLTL